MNIEISTQQANNITEAFNIIYISVEEHFIKHQNIQCKVCSCDFLLVFCISVYSSGSQTFLKKLRNGPLAIFLMAHGPLEKLTQINTKQHVDFLLYQCDEGTCFFANLFKENKQFTRVRLKSHIAVSFSETNTAAATHQVFTFKPSAKKLDPFCYCTFSIIRKLHAKGAIALM